MSLDHVHQLIYSYQPVFQEETVYKKYMLDFLKMHPDALLRSCHLGHFTASCWLVNFPLTHALLMHHVKLDCWIQTGGHADGDYRLHHVAKKEAIEESGLLSIEPRSSDIFDIDIHLIPPYKQVSSHYHFDVRFLMYADSNEPITRNEESHAMRWIALPSIETYNNERSITRMRDKTLAITPCG